MAAVRGVWLIDSGVLFGDLHADLFGVEGGVGGNYRPCERIVISLVYVLSGVIGVTNQ